MRDISQRGFSPIFALLLLLVGLGVSIYVVQQQTFFKPKAAVTELAKITNEDYETKLNPFGDAWAWKKPNTGAPVAASAPTHYITVTDPDGSILERHAQYLAKSNVPFLYFDSYEAHTEGQNPKSIALLSRVKQLNPNMKFLAYFVSWEAPPGMQEIMAKADAGDANFEAFFIHKKGLPPTKENRLTGRPDHPEWGYSPFMNITNPNYRAFIIPKLIEALDTAKMDGVMHDALFYRVIDGFDNPAGSIPDEIKAAWPAAMVSLVQELKTAMGPNKYIFANVDDDNPQFMQNDLFQPGRLDGVIFEDPFNNRPDPKAIEKVTKLMDIVDNAGKKSLLIVSGAGNGTTFATTDAQTEKRAQRYFYAAYLMTMRNANNMYLYYHPSSIFYQYNSEAYFREWDINLGSSTSVPENLGNGVFVRKFEKGYVFWNPTDNDYTIQGGVDLYNIDNGQEINAGQVVPARSGAIFVTKSVLNAYNTPPSGSNTPPSTVFKNCDPRPNIARSTQMTQNGMVVTLTGATNENTPSNTLTQVQFNQFANGTVSIGNQIISSAQNVPVQNNSLSFTIKQITKGQPTTIFLKAVDSCGDYDLFFGGGTAAGWPQ